jgi:hypothetical protein
VKPDWSSQELVETASASFQRGLELLWADATEVTVPPRAIVEAVDIVRNVGDR